MKIKKSSKLEEKLTAYHEAGHAVAFYLFGIKLKFITIKPDFEKDELGRTQPIEKPYIPLLRFGNAPSVLEARIDFERLVIIKLAGFAAETKCRYKSESTANMNLIGVGKGIKLHSNEDPTPDNDIGSVRILFKNFQMLNAIDTSLRETEHQMYLQWLWMRTASIITAKEDSWKAVEAVALALLEKKELTGKEAEKIMSKCITTGRLVTSSLHLTGEQMIKLLK